MNISWDASYQRTHPQGFRNYSRLLLLFLFMGVSLGLALMLGANRLLAMVKDIGGLCHIAIIKMFLQLINSSIIFQLRGPFQEHLSPHQFGVSTLRGHEAIPFGI